MKNNLPALAARVEEAMAVAEAEIAAARDGGGAVHDPNGVSRNGRAH